MARAGAKRKKPVTIAALQAVAPRPHIELVEMTVEDPYQDHGQPGPQYARVFGNARESGAVWLHTRGLIDDAQMRAADRFRADYERAALSGASAIDYTVEHVDGGRVRDPITDAMVSAHKSIDAVRNLVGPVVYPVVERICGQGMTIGQYSSSVGIEIRAARAATTVMLRECLGIMAVEYGYAPRKP